MAQVPPALPVASSPAPAPASPAASLLLSGFSYGYAASALLSATLVPVPARDAISPVNTDVSLSPVILASLVFSVVLVAATA